MNRFRTKKKVKEEASSIGRASTEDQHTHSGLKGFLRNKKTPEEEKKELDLTNALPSSDDFRTSLLMTGLSARFSMLREQDDPNTKIGKASDDSVLFPKRQSRLGDTSLGFNGLDDIAEVESIRAPPFMRTDSDSDSLSGSIMSRTRPGEGNNLFGGRQKIYRIPVGTSKSGAGGGMGGRALYEDDVALSAFQKFKQREKDRVAQLGSNSDNNDVEDQGTPLTLPSADTFDTSPFPRSDSPSPIGYSLRRETSSTTSSAARNSTAATSVVSQPSSSVKDGPLSAGQSTNSLVPERSTTRSRRLYEQGLNQDLHEHQSSALSRIDTLSGKRLMGTRTPDYTQSSSPTNFGFNGSARHVLSKASAPNLRSMSPPATISPSGLGLNVSVSVDNSGFRSLSNTLDSTGSAPVSPPLSPPISESDEHPMLPIEPNDRGKATAMGVFQKPTLPYDESRFAQRQLQLQHGRETPLQTLTELPASHEARPSRPLSVARRIQQVDEQKGSGGTVSQSSLGPGALAASRLAVMGPSVKERAKTFLFDEGDDDDQHMSAVNVQQQQQQNQNTIRTTVVVQRPLDEEHPAFRQLPAQRPLSGMKPTNTVTFAPALQNNDFLVPVPPKTTEDSPTLGPGLSGLVRQHLRTTSTSSSIYSTAPTTTDNYNGEKIPTPVDSPMDPKTVESMTIKLNPWNDDSWSRTAEQALHLSTVQPDSWQSPTEFLGDLNNSSMPTTQYSRSGSDLILDEKSPSDDLSQKDVDDFASQLASARRRVQERLTTYAESDSSRGTSPLMTPTEPSIPLPHTKPKPMALLRTQSSRGSLRDRGRDASQTKAMKMLGIGAATMSTSPSPSKTSFEDVSPPSVRHERVNDASSHASHGERPANPPLVTSWATDVPDNVVASAHGDSDGDIKTEASVHPGLQAFRKARRQLQGQRESEVMGRYMDEDLVTHSIGSRENSPSSERRRTQMVRDRKPPPIYYQQRDTSQDSWSSRGGGSRSTSRSKTSLEKERQRSGSDTSTNGNNNGSGNLHARPALTRLRSTNSATGESQHQDNGLQQQHLGVVRNGGFPMRSPGLPGTDIRRSPHMPLQSYQNNISPISPIERPAGSGRSTPTSAGLRPVRPGPSPPRGTGTTANSSLNESMKKVVNKNDISEPTFLRSTSRVPTVNLPQSVSAPEVTGPDGRSHSGSGSRSRSGSSAGVIAPPLPPINPLRKQPESRARSIGNFLRRRGGEAGQADTSTSSPHLAMTDGSYGRGSSSDEDDGNSRRMIHKQPSDIGGVVPQRMNLPGGMI